MRDHAPMDQMEYSRRKASPAIDSYLQPQTLPGLMITTVRRPLTVRSTPAFLILVQATIANAGTIYLGGGNVDAASGIELDGGRGFLFTSSPTPMQSLGGDMGISRALFQPYRDASGAPVRTAEGYLLFDLKDIYVIADRADQGLRVMYIAPVR